MRRGWEERKRWEGEAERRGVDGREEGEESSVQWLALVKKTGGNLEPSKKQT